MRLPGFHYLLCSAIFSLMVLALATANADDALEKLKAHGGVVTLSKTKSSTTEVPTALDFKDCSKLSIDDYKSIGSIETLERLSLGLGATDQGIAAIPGLKSLAILGTNGLNFSDDSVDVFAKFPKLKTLAIYHPDARFTGRGLNKLAGLNELEFLTVAGSFSFNDDGMNAIAELKQLKQLRVFHAGNTNAGVAKLRELPLLESLVLGQRLTSKGESCPNDKTIDFLVEIKTLKVLDLQEARLSHDALAKLASLPKLERLTLTGIDIPEEDIDRLQKAMPKVRLTHTKPNDVYQKRINSLFGAK